MLRAMFYRGVFICVHLKLRMYYSALCALPCRPHTGVIPDRREPYRRVPLGRVHLDERRLDEVQ